MLYHFYMVCNFVVYLISRYSDNGRVTGKWRPEKKQRPMMALQ